MLIGGGDRVVHVDGAPRDQFLGTVMSLIGTMLAMMAAAQAYAKEPQPSQLPNETISVEQQFAEAARVGRQQLPIVTDGATITDIRAVGAELITTLKVPVLLTEDQADQLVDLMTTKTCDDSRLVGLVRGGGRITYKIMGPHGKAFAISVDRCPG